jgi:hypothetical protein
MDVPTIIVTIVTLSTLLIVIFVRFFRLSHERILRTEFISLTVVWALMTYFGEFFYPWANNGACSKYLGCVGGFAGYDAFEHLFFGLALAIGLIWFFEYSPKYSLLHSNLFKTLIVIVALVTLVSVFWEIIECLHDALRLDILHESLRNFKLHIDLLDQPNNLDTMGDLTFALLGSIIGFCVSDIKRVR